ncbi:DgyrCDS11800 [Dimorphilus gyrociliatus]|uniref:DgyrCDS11800 n=1 Tax=Dimorphilus gyrociliatus TaxID=2664684 RepID=A0A7I8W4J1_9ANNE|nr:DgyrCDS11800 [Dimorphilus gyrociliatus]
MYQVWKFPSGEPISREEDIFATSCVLTPEKERVIVSSSNTHAEAIFQVILVSTGEILKKFCLKTHAIITEMQLTADGLSIVGRNQPEKKASNYSYISFKYGQNSFNAYDFLRGQSYDSYSPTSTIVLKNGLAASTGLNGDIQLWDVSTCEYEGNLCEDETVKDTRNPSLHNHEGSLINCMKHSDDGKYLICGASNGGVSCWDLDNDALLYSINAHKPNSVRCVAVSSDSQVIVTAGSDFIVKVWSLSKPDKPICTTFIHYLPNDLIISKDRQQMVIIGQHAYQSNRLMLFRLRNT